LDIRFNGKTIPIQAGDTVASALYRAGQRIFTRSFKYHRPRGLLCCSGHCPNCLMNVDGIPNVRTCITEARAGMAVKHQNARPSLDFDYLAIAQRFDWMMPVGWYYKNFTNPRMWHLAESQIRKVAGLGDPPPPDAPEAVYEHSHMQASVAVIGGGEAGLNAAREAASQGERVVVVDDQPHRAMLPDSKVTLLSRSYCFGLYEGNLLGVVQQEPHSGARERLVHIRAKRIIVATGAYEAPLTFRNNDLPGIMLSSAVRRLIHRHGIQPGTRAVIISDNAGDSNVAAELRNVGITVVASVPASDVLEATGGKHVTGLRTRRGNFSCDLVVMCGHRIPDAGLLSQAGAKLEWSTAAGAFVPVEFPANITAVGDVLGVHLKAAAPIPTPANTTNKRTFVCLCNDVTTQDLCDSVAEGFDHIELLKRYTTTTMGPCQGRMCQLQAIGICARETGRTIPETGVSTPRPPNPGVTLGALSGARHHPIRRTPMHYQHEELGAVWMDMGDWKRPRYYKHPNAKSEQECVLQEYQAVRQAVGVIDVSTLGKLSLRGRDGGKLLDKVYTNRFSDLKPGRVRYAVLCDEAGIILDDGTVSRVGGRAPLPYGRGSVERSATVERSELDTGFFITTTTGNLDFVEQWLEWWLAGAGQDAEVNNLTSALAAVNLAGPKARDVLGALTDCDLSTQAFPYMACRNADVAGVPALLMRIGFVGETGWEIHYPAESGEHLWNALMDAGKPFGIRPFGVEAQRLLRLEKRHVIVGVDTDALTSPYEAGMSWVVKSEKDDFIGKVALAKLAGAPAQQTLVGFTMNAAEIPEDGAAILVNGALAGRVTSARYSPAVQKPIGLGWVIAAAAAEGAGIEIRVAGTPVRATVTQHVFYDPDGARLRM
jgi:sarcosine oxidase, subunit alpha